MMCNHKRWEVIRSVLQTRFCSCEITLSPTIISHYLQQICTEFFNNSEANVGLRETQSTKTLFLKAENKMIKSASISWDLLLPVCTYIMFTKKCN